MYKLEEDGRYRVISGKLHPRNGELLDSIGYEETMHEVCSTTIKSRRRVTVRLTYAIESHDALTKKDTLMCVRNIFRDRHLSVHADSSTEREEAPAASKYNDDVATLKYLERSAYTRGIDDISTGLDHSLEHEWNGRKLSWVHWTGRTTTTQEEWAYVMGAACTNFNFAGRDEENGGVSLDGFMQRVNGMLAAQWGHEGSVVNEPLRPRQHIPSRTAARPSGWGSFHAISEAMNGALDEDRLLTREEVIAVRLYTGPGFAPLNGWLREVAALPEPPASSIRWGAWTPERALMGADAARRDAAMDAQTSFGMTAFYLVTALRKIAAAPAREASYGKLYRGLKGALPGSFWMPDDMGVICATDTAFMSTSLERETSIFYLTKRDAHGLTPSEGLLWELTSGSEDDGGYHCGADVSMLSQFASEKEVLFPPYTMLRVNKRPALDGILHEQDQRPDRSKEYFERISIQLDRTRALVEVPGVWARQARRLALWQSVCAVVAYAKEVLLRTNRTHAVITSVDAETGCKITTVQVTPTFTGI